MSFFLPETRNPETTQRVAGGGSYTVPAGKWAVVALILRGGDTTVNGDIISAKRDMVYITLSATETYPFTEIGTFYVRAISGTVTMKDTASAATLLTLTGYTPPTAPPLEPIRVGKGMNVDVASASSAAGWFVPDRAEVSNEIVLKAADALVLGAQDQAWVMEYPVINQT